MALVSPPHLQCLCTGTFISYLTVGLFHLSSFWIISGADDSQVDDSCSNSDGLCATDALHAYACRDGISSCGDEQVDEASLLQATSFVHVGARWHADVSDAIVRAATVPGAAAAPVTAAPLNVTPGAAFSGALARFVSTGLRLKHAEKWLPVTDAYKPSTDHPHEFWESATFYAWCCFVLALLGFVFFHMYTNGMVLPWRFLGVWIVISAVYCFLMWGRFGSTPAIYWLVGWFIELFFSLENIFVYHVMVKAVGTPPYLCRYVLFLVILCQVVFQAAFFMGLGEALSHVKLLPFVLGIWLLYLSYASYRECQAPAHDEVVFTDSFIYRAAMSCFGSRLVNNPKVRTFFTTTKDGRLAVTMLVPLFFVILGVDFCMEIDSTMTKIETIDQPYIAFTSSSLAAFCVPDLFFVAEQLFRRYSLLKYAIVFILLFFAFDLLTSEFIEIPMYVGLLLQLLAMAVCIFLSWCFGYTDLQDHELMEAVCWCGARFSPDSTHCSVCTEQRRRISMLADEPSNANDTTDSAVISVGASRASSELASSYVGSETQQSRSNSVSLSQPSSPGRRVSQGHRRWANSHRALRDQERSTRLMTTEHRSEGQEGSPARSQQPSSHRTQEQSREESKLVENNINKPAASGGGQAYTQG